MAGLGKYAHEALARWMAGTAMPVAPTSLKLGLSAADPLEDASGLTEPIGAGYARQEVPVSISAGIDGGTLITVTANVIFGPVVDSDWAPLTHGALFDQAGNLLFFGPLGVSRTAPIGDTISFGAGAIQFLVK
jgi:hypothetical protein